MVAENPVFAFMNICKSEVKSSLGIPEDQMDVGFCSYNSLRLQSFRRLQEAMVLWNGWSYRLRHTSPETEFCGLLWDECLAYEVSPRPWYFGCFPWSRLYDQHDPSLFTVTYQNRDPFGIHNLRTNSVTWNSALKYTESMFNCQHDKFIVLHGWSSWNRTWNSLLREVDCLYTQRTKKFTKHAAWKNIPGDGNCCALQKFKVHRLSYRISNPVGLTALWTWVLTHTLWVFRSALHSRGTRIKLHSH